MKVSKKVVSKLKDTSGMEMLQVAILIGIAVVIGVLFKTQIGIFVADIFETLEASDFT